MKTKPPSPIPRRECECGCGNSFQPNRKDHIYLNTQHANFGYNHGKRKELNPNNSTIQKITRRNDSLLRKYHDLKPSENYEFPLGIITAEGFDTRFFTGTSQIEGETFHAMYNYCYKLSTKEKFTFILIKQHV